MDGTTLAQLVGFDTSFLGLDIKPSSGSDSVVVGSHGFVIAIRNGLLRFLTMGLVGYSDGYSAAPVSLDTLDSPINLTDGYFHRLVLVRTADKTELYLDGVLQSSTPTVGSLTADLYLGGLPCDDRNFIGSIKNLRGKAIDSRLVKTDSVENECIITTLPR